MPTMNGSIYAQDVGYRIVEGDFIDSVTMNFSENRHITGDAAIALLTHPKKAIWVECGFSRVISNGHLEEFDPPLPRILRTNVTSLTFRTAVSSDCKVRSRWVINFWQ